MAAEKEIFGRIDCPCCKTANGVRITKDKNGNPFAFCDAKCDMQIRIGGSAYRIKLFYENHPEIAKAMNGEPVSVTEEKPLIVQEAPKKSGFSLGGL